MMIGDIGSCTIVYGFRDERLRYEEFHRLTSSRKESRKLWMLSSDFNEMLSSNENDGEYGFDFRRSRKFKVSY